MDRNYNWNWLKFGQFQWRDHPVTLTSLEDVIRSQVQKGYHSETWASKPKSCATILLQSLRIATLSLLNKNETKVFHIGVNYSWATVLKIPRFFGESTVFTGSISNASAIKMQAKNGPGRRHPQKKLLICVVWNRYLWLENLLSYFFDKRPRVAEKWCLVEP